MESLMNYISMREQKKMIAELCLKEDSPIRKSILKNMLSNLRNGKKLTDKQLIILEKMS
jgi:hypothetical protein